jgi:hypothetical protein
MSRACSEMVCPACNANVAFFIYAIWVVFTDFSGSLTSDAAFYHITQFTSNVVLKAVLVRKDTFAAIAFHFYTAFQFTSTVHLKTSKTPTRTTFAMSVSNVGAVQTVNTIVRRIAFKAILVLISIASVEKPHRIFKNMVLSV